MRQNIFDSTRYNIGKKKIVVLIPCRDTMFSLFTASLVEMVKATIEAGHDIHVMYDQSTILVSQREKLMMEAIRLKADYALWLDSDMMFPSSTALRLMAHDLPVVCCNYMKRALPLQTVAYKTRGDWDSWLPLEPSDKLEEVEGIGMGCFMVKPEVVKDLQRPFFEFEYYNGDWHGEDFYFQKKLRDAGHKIMVDMNLSYQIRHIGQWAFGPNIGTNQEKIKKIEQSKKEDSSKTIAKRTNKKKVKKDE